MIRAGELPLFFETIARTISEELRPDLRTSHARKSADYLLDVLNRLIAQSRDAERIAAEHGERWAQLCTRAGLQAGPNASPLRTSSERLERDIGRIQQAFLAGDRPDATRASHGDGRTDGAWFREAAAASLALWESVERSVHPLEVKVAETTSNDDPESLRTRLGTYLAQRFPGLPEDPVSTLKVAPGGNTKRTALFSLRPNALLHERLVLRQDRPLNLTGTRTVDEFPIVERLFRLGLHVPQPILVEPDPDVLDGSFMVVSEIADAVPAGTYFAEDRVRLPRMIGPQFGRDAAEELARLHRLTVVTGDDGRQRWQDLREGVEKAYARWKSLDKPPNSLVIDLGFAWLRDQTLDTDRPRCLIHGDYGVHNMMARDGRLAAVLDWELAEEGDPTIDLAECRMMMVADTLPWEDFVTVYLAAGGDPRACDQKAVDYYCVWSYTVKFGLMMAEAWSAYVNGVRTDSLMASVASQSMDRILLLAARALSMATGARPPA